MYYYTLSAIFVFTLVQTPLYKLDLRAKHTHAPTQAPLFIILINKFHNMLKMGICVKHIYHIKNWNSAE